MNVELLVETQDVAVLKLNGRPRSGLDGRHKRLVVYAGATVNAVEVARLLHDAASRIEKTLPRDWAS